MPEQIAWLRTALPRIRVRVAPLGLQIAGSPSYLDRLEAVARGIAVPVADCDPGRRFLFVDERGIIAPCSFTGSGYGVPIDALVSVDAIAQLPRRFAERRRERLLAPCHA